MADEKTIDQRIEAIAMNLELLSGSVSDLTASVHALVARDREQNERDREYMLVLSEVLKAWANGHAHEK